MLLIVGFVVVLGAVVGGFLMAGGVLSVLNQPAEFIVIGGAAVGSLLVSTPAKVLKMTAGQLKGAVSGAGASRGDYGELLSMLFQIFKLVRKTGVVGHQGH